MLDTPPDAATDLGAGTQRSWEALRDALANAVAVAGSLTAVERAAGLKRRALKNFAARQRTDRPNGALTTLSESAERQLRAYLRRAHGWPDLEPTALDMLRLAQRAATPAPPARELFWNLLAQVGSYDEVSPSRITAYEADDLLRVYEPVGGLGPEDYRVFAPTLWEELSRAELSEAVVANLIELQGVEPYAAKRAASRLHLYDREGFAANDIPPDFEALVSEAISIEGLGLGRSG